jgi:hypothetical protein
MHGTQSTWDARGRQEGQGLEGHFKLLMWFWKHSEAFVQLLDALQQKLPLVVGALRWSADGLDRLGVLESQIVTTINDAEQPLRDIPLPGIASDGFYDALANALAKLNVPIITPSNQIKNSLNQMRVPTVTTLGKSQVFATLADTWHERASTLYSKTSAPNNPIAKSAQALREIAALIESTQNP